MAKIVVEINGSEKEYEVPASLTFREMGIIKKLSGVRGAEINEALTAGDAEVVAAMALIAARRAGDPLTEDDVLDMDVESLKLTEDEPEQQADPTPAADAAAGTSSEASESAS